MAIARWSDEKAATNAARRRDPGDGEALNARPLEARIAHRDRQRVSSTSIIIVSEPETALDSTYALEQIRPSTRKVMASSTET